MDDHPEHEHDGGYHDDGVDAEDLEDDEQYFQQQEELLKQLVGDNEHIAKENRLLEAFLNRVAPASSNTTIEDDPTKKKRVGKKGKQEAKRDMFLPLTDDDKNEIASQELEHLQQELEEAKVNGDKELEDVRTLMEEVDMRIADVKRDTFEFKRDIIIGAENPRTGKTSAEKMLRFMEERVRQKEGLIEKLRLKNTTVKVQISKMEQQLQQKEEMGEVLHLVDFDQLKIENQQYMERIEQKNNELLSLKLTTSRTIQVLNSLKFQLNALVQEGTRLRNEINERSSDLSNFDKNFEQAQAEQRNASKTLRRLQLEQEETDQPQILDYIKLKHEAAELEKTMSDWKRKVELSEMEEKRALRVLKSVASHATSRAASHIGSLPETPSAAGTR